MTKLRATVGLLPVMQVLLAERSVSRTAEMLDLTQSAVSQALARARSVWGDPILIRQGQRMLPTPFAVELAAQLDAWVSRTEALLSRPDLDPREARTQVVIIANDYSEIALLPPFLRRLNELAPGITAVLRSVESRPLDSDEFSRGEIHFAVAGIPAPPGPFDSQVLFREHFVMIARRRHPALRGLTLQKYLQYPHAVVSPQGQGVGGLIDDALAALGSKRRVALSLTRFTSLPALLRGTDLVANVPSRFAELPEVRAVCDAVDLPFESPVFSMSLIWHQRHGHDPLHQWLRGLLGETLSR